MRRGLGPGGFIAHSLTCWYIYLTKYVLLLTLHVYLVTKKSFSSNHLQYMNGIGTWNLCVMRAS